MAKAGRGKTRRDSKNRILRPGESVRANGKYQYKYHIDGKPHFVYSWKLEPTDRLPPGKLPCLSLRELEKQVNAQNAELARASALSTFPSLKTSKRSLLNSNKKIKTSSQILSCVI